MNYDLIIIGAGPAGMTAGVFAARKGLKTLIISKDIGGQVNWTTDIENYMGFQEINGQALMEKFEAQVKECHLERILSEVKFLEPTNGVFKVGTKDQQDLTGKVVLVCPGKRPKTLNVPGETEFRNKGVSYCSTCDGPLFRDIPVAVIGGGNSAAQSVLDLLHYASEVHLISLSELTADPVLIDRLKEQPKLKTYLEYSVIEIKGSQVVERLVIEAVKSKQRLEIPVQGVFIEIGLDPNTEFLNELVEQNEAREIKIDCDCRTNLPGLFAAGDATTVPEKQIIIAAGEGAKAALKAWEFLVKSPAH